MADPRPLRAAVLGLGMIGRHHARVLQSLEGVEFVGAADPGGDSFHSVHDPALVFASLEALLDRARPDFAVVAVPTEAHADTVRALAASGIHALIEKPLAATSAEAADVVRICTAAGVRAATGHVERFNPAMIGLRRRVADGLIGDLQLVTTERVGPFPQRVRDVGVVKDLATHDLDLIQWVTGQPIAAVAARTLSPTRREHEDVVLALGELRDGTLFNCMVDWLSPTKRRRLRALGSRGMLQADTVVTELTHFAHADVPSAWDSAQALRGVAEGDVTTYALSRTEPLRSELMAFRDFVAGDDDAPVVSLAEGLAAVRAAELVLASAASGQTAEAPA